MLLDIAPARWSAVIGGVRLTVWVGVDQHGEPALDVAYGPPGNPLETMLRALAGSITVGLRNGVPLSAYTRGLLGQRFEPAGPTGDVEVPDCTSVVDYMARSLQARCGK